MQRIDFHRTITFDYAVVVREPLTSQSGPPINFKAPGPTGGTTVGSVITTTDGSWLGAATITFTYQWWRLVTSGGLPVTSGGLFVGILIPGATNQSYTTTADDVGEFLYCEVTATNFYGSAMAQSTLIGPIT